MNQETAKPQVSAAEEKLTNDINDIANLFETSHKETLGRVDEGLFVNVFLPFFAGDEKQVYNVTTEMWLNLVHSPYNEAIVINAAGDELFRVPALFDRNAFKPLDNTDKDARMPSIFDMMQTVMNVGKQGYAAMINYFNNEMKRRDFMFAQAPDAAENIRRWNEIFVRYGRKPIFTETPSNATNVSAVPTAGLDSQDFEELN